MPENNETETSEFGMADIPGTKEPLPVDRDGEYRKRKRKRKKGDDTPLPVVFPEEDRPTDLLKKADNKQAKSPETDGSQSFFAKLARRKDRVIAFITGAQ